MFPYREIYKELKIKKTFLCKISLHKFIDIGISKFEPKMGFYPDFRECCSRCGLIRRMPCPAFDGEQWIYQKEE